MASRKRRKLDTDTTKECFSDVISEFDLEIALRRRLAETIESRITWARLLQQSLQAGSSGASTSFKDSAFEALATIERPLDVLFKRDIFPILRPNPKPSARPLPNKREAIRNPKTNFLYIRSAYLHPPYDDNHVQTYLIRCPSCFSRKFTSLQGLLNHGRLAHGLEWGTHDECVRACIVVDPELDLEAGIEVGAGPNGLLPGLRSLFEMAVGVHQQPNDLEFNLSLGPNEGGEKTEPFPTGSHLVATLGLHEDTPALAPFLGKQAIRRKIKVWPDRDEIIDIDGFEEVKMQDPQLASVSYSRPNWRMQFTSRNDFEQEEATIPELDPIPDAEPPESPASLPKTTAENGESQVSAADPSDPGMMGSRFHFVARVVVTDRSLWIPPEKRIGFSDSHTHKWMVSVEAPSYSYHITTVLKRLTVSSLTGSKFSPSMVSCPPFVIVGTTDEPFLAKIELHFNGAPGADGGIVDQPVVLEHWVELDFSKSATPIIGDEQVVDIELDKGTVLLPVQKGYIPVGAKVLWSQASETLQIQDLASPAEPIPVYRQMLNGLVGRFPMTLKELKGGRQLQPQVPYKLVSTTEFEGYVAGRRKAIEWSRARAIRDAYTQEIGQLQHAAHEHIPLTVADVYRWLLEGGYFLRPMATPNSTIQNDKKMSGDDRFETWCPSCGMSLQAHTAYSGIKAEYIGAPLGPVKAEAYSKSEDSQPPLEKANAFPVACNLSPCISTLPMLNILRSRPADIHNLALAQKLIKPQQTRLRSFRGATLIASVDSKFIMATYHIAHSLKLSNFQSQPTNDPAPYPLDEFGHNHVQVESRLAPFTLLALAAKTFMRALVQGGLQLAITEKSACARPTRKKRKQDAPDEPIEHSMLTPTHVLQSVILRAQSPSPENGRRDVAIYECLAKLGIPSTCEDISIISKDVTHGGTQESHHTIKQEGDM